MQNHSKCPERDSTEQRRFLFCPLNMDRLLKTRHAFANGVLKKTGKSGNEAWRWQERHRKVFRIATDRADEVVEKVISKQFRSAGILCAVKFVELLERNLSCLCHYNLPLFMHWEYYRILGQFNIVNVCKI